MSEEETIKKLQEMIGLCTEKPKHIAYNEQRAIETILDLYKQEKEKNKELELEKEINQEAINIANNQLCNYELGYQAGLHKEITATEVVIRNRENFIIQQQIKKLKDTIHRLHKAMDEGNEKVKQEYISKDKIRAKIDEIKAKKDFPKFADYEWSNTEKILFHQADILDDLLEED